MTNLLCFTISKVWWFFASLTVAKVLFDPYESESESDSRSVVTPRAVARQAPLSMQLSRQEYWSG